MAYKMVELNKEAAEKGYEMTNSEYYARLSWEETCKERDDLKYQVKALDALKNGAIKELQKMQQLIFEVVEFIGRCNLYKEKEQWFNDDGLFCNSDKELIEYVEKLNRIQSAPSAQ